MKSQIFTLIILSMTSGLTLSHYSGPFLLWGLENLNDMKIPTLQAIDDSSLREIYTKASAIVIFIRNATTRLNYENFPQLSDIISKNEWLYLPQEILTSDPLEYNVNAEVFTLTGPVVMQDNEVAAFYRDAQINYGNKNVLGILAARNENNEHVILKREVNETTKNETPNITLSKTPDEPVNDLMFIAKDKAMLYTSVLPELNITNENGKTTTHLLREHLPPTGDERNDKMRLIVKFVLKDRNIFLKFVFYKSGGYWQMNEVELEDPGNSGSMSIIGRPPSGPIGNYSYVCGETFIYRNSNLTLKLKNIQIQPFMNETTKFDDALDCIGYTSPSILAGIFITFILLSVLSIALTAIMDIRTPNRFESRSSKQLTFTVQE